MRCNNFYLYGPAVPGAIAPIDATENMTNPVGIKRCRLFVDAPTTSELSALNSRVEALEEGGTGGGGNCYVCVTDQNTAFNNFLSLTYTTLPDGAVIDKYEVVAGLSGGTVPVSMEIYPTGAGLGISAAPGGYCNWTIASSTSGDVTITTLNMGSNTLYPNTITANDIISYARIYYHI